jgi:hypothetical protein
MLRTPANTLPPAALAPDRLARRSAASLGEARERAMLTSSIDGKIE